MNHVWIQRWSRKEGRHSTLKELQPDNPVPISLSTRVICETCHTAPAQWFFYKVVNETYSGTLNNSVSPGYKCNVCKEKFLWDYLKPNWTLDNHTQKISNSWQVYGQVELPVTAEVCNTDSVHFVEESNP